MLAWHSDAFLYATKSDGALWLEEEIVGLAEEASLVSVSEDVGLSTEAERHIDFCDIHQDSLV
jgi:hypothetical protein